MSPEDKSKTVQEIVTKQRQSRKVKSIHAVHAAAKAAAKEQAQTQAYDLYGEQKHRFYEEN